MRGSKAKTIRKNIKLLAAGTDTIDGAELTAAYAYMARAHNLKPRKLLKCNPRARLMMRDVKSDKYTNAVEISWRIP